MQACAQTLKEISHFHEDDNGRVRAQPVCREERSITFSNVLELDSGAKTMVASMLPLCYGYPFQLDRLRHSNALGSSCARHFNSSVRK